MKAIWTASHRPTRWTWALLTCGVAASLATSQPTWSVSDQAQLGGATLTLGDPYAVFAAQVTSAHVGQVPSIAVEYEATNAGAESVRLAVFSLDAPWDGSGLPLDQALSEDTIRGAVGADPEHTSVSLAAGTSDGRVYLVFELLGDGEVEIDVALHAQAGGDGDEPSRASVRVEPL